MHASRYAWLGVPRQPRQAAAGFTEKRPQGAMRNVCSECKSQFGLPIVGVMYAEHARCKTGQMSGFLDMVQQGSLDLSSVAFHFVETLHRHWLMALLQPCFRLRLPAPKHSDIEYLNVLTIQTSVATIHKILSHRLPEWMRYEYLWKATSFT